MQLTPCLIGYEPEHFLTTEFPVQVFLLHFEAVNRYCGHNLTI